MLFGLCSFCFKCKNVKFVKEIEVLSKRCFIVISALGVMNVC